MVERGEPRAQTTRHSCAMGLLRAHVFRCVGGPRRSALRKESRLLVSLCDSIPICLDPSLPKSVILNDHIMSFVDGIGHYSTGNEIAAGMYQTLPLPASELKFGEITRISWNSKGRVDDSEEGGHGSLVMKDTLTIHKLVSGSA